jgi:hypothetical protein
MVLWWLSAGLVTVWVGIADPAPLARMTNPLSTTAVGQDMPHLGKISSYIMESGPTYVQTA